MVSEMKEGRAMIIDVIKRIACNRWLKSGIGLVFVLVAGTMLSCWLCTQSVCNYRLEDVVRLRAKELAFSIVAYYEETGSWPASEHATQQDFSKLAVDEMARYYSETNAIGVNNRSAVDRWGQPYGLVIRGVGEGNDSFLNEVNPKAHIVVWSSGKNRRNEFGKGDDIVFWWDAEASISVLRRDYSGERWRSILE